MRWLPYALLCSVFIASADFFVKLASNKIASSMGMLVFGTITFAIGLIWVSYLKFTKQPILTASMLGILLLHEPFTWRY